MADNLLMQSISDTEGISGYDAAAKVLFSFKIVIAFFLAALVPEFKNIGPTLIAQKYVEPRHRGERILGLGTELLRPKGSKSILDMLIEVIMPVGRIMLLNLEIQRSFYEEEPIFRRSWTYDGRLISNLDVAFIPIDTSIELARMYAKICGLWILTNPPEKLKNSVAYVPPIYDIDKEYANWPEGERRYADSLQNIVVCAGRGNVKSPDYQVAADFADVLLDSEITAEKKMDILKTDFDFPVGKSIEEVLKQMERFGTEILERGEEKANVRALAFMTSEGKMSLTDALKTMGLPLTQESKYAELLKNKK